MVEEEEFSPAMPAKTSNSEVFSSPALKPTKSTQTLNNQVKTAENSSSAEQTNPKTKLTDVRKALSALTPDNNSAEDCFCVNPIEKQNITPLDKLKKLGKKIKEDLLDPMFINLVVQKQIENHYQQQSLKIRALFLPIILLKIMLTVDKVYPLFIGQPEAVKKSVKKVSSQIIDWLDSKKEAYTAPLKKQLTKLFGYQSS